MVCRCACGFGIIVNLIFITFLPFELSHFWCLSITVNACMFNPFKPGVPEKGTGRQCRPRSDGIVRGVSSGSTLFAFSAFL